MSERSCRASLAFLLVVAAPAAAQRIELVRALGGESAEYGVGVVPVADGCVVAGWATVDERTDAGVLQRLDRAGDVVWRRTFPDGDDAALWTVRPLAGGDFVAAGWTKSARGDLDAFVVRASADGEVRWTRAYEGAADDRLWSLDVADGELIAAGESAASGRSSALVLRIALDGELRERRNHGEAEIERVFAVQALGGGAYVLAGLAGSGPREGPGFDARIAAYDARGRRTWDRVYGGKGFDVAHDVRRAPDGKLHVAGYTDAGPGRGMDAFLLVLSASGEIESAHTYGDARDDRAVHLELSADGSRALVGYSRDGDDSDIVVRAIDRAGAMTWEQRFGGEEPELGRSIALAPDGAWLVVGHSKSYAARETLLLLRLRPR